MKVEVAKAKDQVLDYLVARCGDWVAGTTVDDLVSFVLERSPNEMHYWPSTDWAQAGPIIEREWLDVTPWPNESDENLRWQCKQHDSIDCVAFGSTPLIAAMRCYVASKLGDEVEVPDELCESEVK